MNILIYPNPILNKKSKMIKMGERIDQSLITQMTKLILEHDGLGLAAPQVGVLKQFVIVVNPFNKKIIILLNPKYSSVDREKEYDTEGCLSIPFEVASVERFKKIKVTAYDLDWKPIQFLADGLLARVIQHEIDHLHGITLADRDVFLKETLLTNKRIN